MLLISWLVIFKHVLFTDLYDKQFSGVYFFILTLICCFSSAFQECPMGSILSNRIDDNDILECVYTSFVVLCFQSKWIQRNHIRMLIRIHLILCCPLFNRLSNPSLSFIGHPFLQKHFFFNFSYSFSFENKRVSKVFSRIKLWRRLLF